MINKDPKKFFRFCRRCGNPFNPTTKAERLCEICWDKKLDHVRKRRRKKSP